MPSTTYLNNAILTATVSGQTFPTITTAYIALYSVAPTASGGGTELTGSNYSRAVVSCTVANGEATNGSPVSFAAATADWDTAMSWGILDAASAGNLLYYGVFPASQTVLSGDTLTFDAGNIQITIA